MNILLKIPVIFILLLPGTGLFAQQILEMTLLDASTREPVEGVSVIVRLNGQDVYYFSNQEGRVRVNAQTASTLLFFHLNYENESLQVSEKQIDRIYLKKKEHFLEEVVIQSGKTDLYTVLEKLLYKIRRTDNDISTQQFQYELTTIHDSLLIEKSDGIVEGTVSLSKGIQQLDFITGRYCLRESHPFFNLSFLQVPGFSSLLKKTNGGRIITPLNYDKISRSNATIESQPCENCGAGQRLLLITPKNNTHASVQLLLDVVGLNIEQINIRDHNSTVVRAIDQHHRIEQLECYLNFKVFENQIRYIDVRYSLDYVFGQQRYDSILVRLVLKPTNRANNLRLIHLGNYAYSDSYERLITYPLNLSFLEEQYHRTDIGLLRAVYSNMAKSDALYGNNKVLYILQESAGKSIQVWDTSFCTQNIYQIKKQAQEPGGDMLLKNKSFFEFNWVFLEKSSNDSIFYESAPTFVDIKNSIFYSSDDAHALLFYNLIFDYAEWMRLQTCQKLGVTNSSPEEKEQLIKKMFHQTKNDIQAWAYKSSYGTKISALKPLNDLILAGLKKDNFKSYHRLQWNAPIESKELIYPDMLALFGEYDKAIGYYTDLLNSGNLTMEETLILVYNRMQCYAKVKNYDALCLDVQYLVEQRYADIDAAYLSLCKL